MFVSVVTFLLISLILSGLYMASLHRKIRKEVDYRRSLVDQIKSIQTTVAKLENERESLRDELTKEAVQFYEEELQYMGAEIHDDLIQRLTEFRLTMTKLDLSEDITELQAAGLRLKSQFPDIVDSVRRISRRLLPANLVAGSFTNSIRALCAQMEKPGVLRVIFESTGKELPLPEDHALHLYRIVQEIIHNTMKHSLAWHLYVRISWTNRLLIEMEDDGRKVVRKEDIEKSSAFRTLKMRTLKSGAEQAFSKAEKGMLVTVKYDPEKMRGG